MFLLRYSFLGEGLLTVSVAGVAHLGVPPLFGQDREDRLPGVVLRTRAVPLQEVWKCQSAAVPLWQAAARPGAQLCISG